MLQHNNCAQEAADHQPGQCPWLQICLCEGVSRLPTFYGLQAAGNACRRISTGLNWTTLRCMALAPPFASTIDTALQGNNFRSM